MVTVNADIGWTCRARASLYIKTFQEASWLASKPSFREGLPDFYSAGSRVTLLPPTATEPLTPLARLGSFPGLHGMRQHRNRGIPVQTAMPSTYKPDILIVGGGIVGLAVARAARRRWPEASVTVLEKEGEVGLHGSGRNSGVLHAGFYYTADSLKARFSRDGTRQWTEMCQERGLAINRCGKLVVAKGPEELEGLAELKRRDFD